MKHLGIWVFCIWTSDGVRNTSWGNFINDTFKSHPSLKLNIVKELNKKNKENCERELSCYCGLHCIEILYQREAWG